MGGSGIIGFLLIIINVIFSYRGFNNHSFFDRFKFEVLGEPYLIIDGVLQNQDGVISVKAGRVAALRAGAAPESHDFH